ncbi:UTRA domain-containing protein [Romboutsia timonensis]|uniref:UTRA domain-containing protein n=1 Tax=Romboutsia timonensis TaxID=1776391 RepID=UPI0008DAD386|nr:UTRA domain-containing protein [Romboutsia timonensis]
MCAGLKEVLKEEDSLYRVFREEYNHKIEKAIQIIEPITLNKDSSKLLNRDINSLALKFARNVYTKDQSILEYTISIFTSDKHQYQIMMTE